MARHKVIHNLLVSNILPSARHFILLTDEDDLGEHHGLRCWCYHNQNLCTIPLPALYSAWPNENLLLGYDRSPLSIWFHRGDGYGSHVQAHTILVGHDNTRGEMHQPAGLVLLCSRIFDSYGFCHHRYSYHRVQGSHFTSTSEKGLDDSFCYRRIVSGSLCVSKDLC